MNVHIITASAGTGKTTRLAEVLGDAIEKGSARPDAIIATTFTKQAAAELQNRARSQLLRKGLGREAQSLLTARIGTVNAVCGSLVADFSFELGLSPELRVLDEASAALELERSLATVVSDEMSARLQSFRHRFDQDFDWHFEIQRLIEAARANGLDDAALAASAHRSIASLDECLGPVHSEEDLDAVLERAIDDALAAIDTNLDPTKGTGEYLDLLEKCRRHLRDGRLRWGDWANLTSKGPLKKSAMHGVPVQSAAGRHVGHPRLRREMHELVDLMFDVASRGLAAYQARKRQRGLLDFGDQEVMALHLLSRPDVCAVLREQLDLVLVDEFQDTSPLQLAIFLKLADLARRSVWVGDPKQAIYGFRGTDPSLMDAAIETLTSPSRDPDLVAAAVDAISEQSPQVETLSKSYRSRPQLVDVANAVFTSAFRTQGMTPERVQVAAVRPESSALGPAVSHFRLEPPGRSNHELALALADGVRALLESQPTVWDRSLGVERPARPSDVAVLCRTNKLGAEVAEALGANGLVAVVARVGLLDTAEATLLMAGLRLWVDGGDLVAAATVVRWLDFPQDASAFFERTLADVDWLGSSPALKALLAARQDLPDRDVLAVVDSVVDALTLRTLAAAWGDGRQRVGNLDAFRAHAVRYRDEQLANGAAPSVVGLLRYLDAMADPATRGERRSDTCARVGSNNAISISTWHAAKGLEWPIVVLFGLESFREPQAYGVHVRTDRTSFDVSDPLGGRWIHFWPNPYTNGVQGGPVKDVYTRSQVFIEVKQKTKREALRVLYVGWTRASDRLIFAARKKQLLTGILQTLVEIDPDILRAPSETASGIVPTQWAGQSFDLQVSAYASGPVASATSELGETRIGRAQSEYPAASLAPSSAKPRAARLGDPIRLGTPFSWQATVEADALGTAVHDFLAADDARLEPEVRFAMASRLLAGYAVEGALSAQHLLEIADRLWHWTQARFGDSCRLRREWPVSERLPLGTIASGSVDLLVESAGHVAIVDHKSFRAATAEAKKDSLAGQLGCYADAVARARPDTTVSTWVHLPFDGIVLPLTIASHTM